jgi:hypothetical protein
MANIWVLAIAVFVQIVVSVKESKGISMFDSVEKMHLLARWPVYFALLFTVLIFGIYGPGFAESQFIYFQF